MITLARPGADEYAPAFAGYVTRIAETENILEVLAAQHDEVRGRIDAIPESRGAFRYAPGKWSIKEVVGHLSDTERVFAYRALRIGRGDPTPLPGFDDQSYVAEQAADRQTLSGLAEEWSDVRRASVALFRHFPAEAWLRRGTASDQSISVRALACIIAGHVRHHLQILEARYTR